MTELRLSEHTLRSSGSLRYSNVAFPLLRTLGTKDDEQPSDAMRSLSAPLLREGKKFGIWQLCLFGFFVVAAGPYGIEPSVGAAGPLLAIIALIIIPIVWSLPVSMVTAELATTFPTNGGFVVFVYKIFGWFPAFAIGWCAVTSTVVSHAAIILLLVSYSDAAIAGGVSLEVSYVICFVVALVTIVVNLFDLSFLGRLNVLLFTVILLPLVIVIFWSIPNASPANWIQILPPSRRNYGVLISNVLGSVQAFGIVGSIAGEVENPKRTYPRGMALLILVVVLNYLLPILAETAHGDDWNRWKAGYLVTGAGDIVGGWMKVWVSASAAVSTFSGLFSSLAGNARFVMGMSELGLLPSFFGKIIKRTGSPFVGVVVIEGAALVLALIFARDASGSGFNNLVNSATVVGGVPGIVQLFAFAWLRRTKRDVDRPFCVPGGWPVALLSVIFPTGLFVFLVVSASEVALLIALGILSLGVAVSCVYFFTVARFQPKDDGSPGRNASGESTNL